MVSTILLLDPRNAISQFPEFLNIRIQADNVQNISNSDQSSLGASIKTFGKLRTDHRNLSITKPSYQKFPFKLSPRFEAFLIDLVRLYFKYGGACLAKLFTWMRESDPNFTLTYKPATNVGTIANLVDVDSFHVNKYMHAKNNSVGTLKASQPPSSIVIVPNLCTVFSKCLQYHITQYTC